MDDYPDTVPEYDTWYDVMRREPGAVQWELVVDVDTRADAEGLKEEFELIGDGAEYKVTRRRGQA